MTKSLDTLNHEEGNDLKLYSNLAIVYCALPDNLHYSPSYPLIPFLSLAEDGI